MSTYKPRTNALEWYTQDTWKVSNKLTLDFGVRYSWAMAQRLSAGNNFAPSLFSAANAPVLYVPTSKVDATAKDDARAALWLNDASVADFFRVKASVATGASMFALRNVSSFRISGSRGVKDTEIESAASRTL